jgi:hypothetical protein
MKKEEVDKFLEAYNNYKPLYEQVAKRLHEMMCEKKPQAKLVHGNNVIDNIEVDGNNVIISWGIYEPFEYTESFPIEWLYDDNWYEKYQKEIDDRLEKARMKREENDKKRKEFFNNN